jgi:cytochrome P450 family 9
VAQAVIFLLAGFGTVSSAMSFAMHELAVNPDVQEKLVAEIREHKENNGGNLDYSSIQKMVYMDMVVSGKL